MRNNNITTLVLNYARKKMTEKALKSEERPPLRILLAEDHNVVRNGLRSLLENQADMHIIAEAASGSEALMLLKTKELEPDIILTDINMPDMDGIELIEKIRQTGSRAKMVVLSMLDNEKYVVKAFKAGADGYLLKNVTTQELIFALRHIVTTGPYTCSEITMRLIKRLTQIPRIVAANELPDVEFDERDREVLNLMADGYTNQEIADKLFTSKRTVEGYRQILMNRTGSRNTAALIRFAAINGYLQ